MEVEYTIIEGVKPPMCSISFKLILNESDYILTKQFDDSKRFRSAITQQIDSQRDLINFEEVRRPSDREVDMYFSWGIPEEKRKEDGTIYWESKEYSFRYNVSLDGSNRPNQIIKEIKKEIMKVMGTIKADVPKDDQSCFHKTESISY